MQKTHCKECTCSLLNYTTQLSESKDKFQWTKVISIPEIGEVDFLSLQPSLFLPNLFLNPQSSFWREKKSGEYEGISYCQHNIGFQLMDTYYVEFFPIVTVPFPYVLWERELETYVLSLIWSLHIAWNPWHIMIQIKATQKEQATRERS